MLDLYLRRENEKITTDWYAKPTASGRILNFLSAHPHKMKMNVATAFIQRVMTLSHPKHHMKNKRVTYQILRNNNYPPYAIKKATKKAIKNIERNNEPSITQETPERRYKGIPYVPGLADALEKQLRKTKANITFAMKPLKKLQETFTNMKTKIKKPVVGCVYKVECEKCDMIYVGETERSLETRMREHKNDIKREKTKIENYVTRSMKESFPDITTYRTRTQINAQQTFENQAYIHMKLNPRGSAALQHQIANRHDLAFDNCEILEKCNYKRKLQMLESLHIQLRKDKSMNFKVDTSFIHPTTRQIVTYYKHTKFK